MNDNSILLSEKIQLLKTRGGTLIFEIGDYYVQFVKDKNTREIYFEAVSHYFLDILPTDLIVGFAQLGFTINEGENYSKTVKDENWQIIITDVQQIFESIYKVNYNKSFHVIDDTEVSSKENTSSNGIVAQKINYPFLILIFGAVIFFCFKIFYKDKINASLNELSNEDIKSKYSDADIGNRYDIALAIIDENANPPTNAKIIAFKSLLINIEKIYPGTIDKDISNTIVTSYNFLLKNNYPHSLFEFANGFIFFYKSSGEYVDENFEKEFMLYTSMITNYH